MMDLASGSFAGRRVLIVEDDYLIAVDMAHAFLDWGAQVVGPAGSVEAALQLVEDDGPIDGAVLDVNLGSARVYPVADALMKRDIPFVFSTGYAQDLIPPAYSGVPRLEKPVRAAMLAEELLHRMERGSSEDGVDVA